jgi:O-antigen ligase
MRPASPHSPGSTAPLAIGRAPAAAHGVKARDISDRVKFTFPYVVVLSYLFIEFARPQDWLPPLNALHMGAMVSIAGVLAVVFNRPSIPRLGKYMFAFLGLMAFGVPFAVNDYQAFVTTKNFAILLVGSIIPLMVFVKSYAQARNLFRFWIFVNIWLALYGLIHQGRGIGSFLGDENDFCIVTNMIAPFAFFLLPVASSWLEKLFLGGSLALFLAASVASLSRGGFLGLVATGIFCWLLSPRKVASALAIVLVATLVFLASPPSYWKEMNTIKTSTNENDTGYYRLYYWGIAWKEFLDHPIMGVGPYNFQFQTTDYESEHEKERGHHMWGRVAHSLYFTLLPEYGIIGTLLYFGIVIAGCRDRARLRKRYRTIVRAGPSPKVHGQLRTLYHLTLALDASLIAFLVTGAFISVLYYPHFWLLTAFTVVVHRVFDRVAHDVEPPPPVRSRRFRPIPAPVGAAVI